MILKQHQNSPLSAPQMSTNETVLATFRTWKDHAFLTEQDLFVFITKPSPERDEFLNTLNVSIHFMKTDYAIQTIK
jgi:hypothetical protein